MGSETIVMQRKGGPNLDLRPACSVVVVIKVDSTTRILLAAGESQSIPSDNQRRMEVEVLLLSRHLERTGPTGLARPWAEIFCIIKASKPVVFDPDEEQNVPEVGETRSKIGHGKGCRVSTTSPLKLLVRLKVCKVAVYSQDNNMQGMVYPGDGMLTM